MDLRTLRQNLDSWAAELGFQQLGITRPRLVQDARRLDDWLNAGRHGEMRYMARHRELRVHPRRLAPGTVRVLSVRMDYLDASAVDPWQVLADGNRAYISRYALGRDYHKVLRRRLKRLARRIESAVGAYGYRVLVDSAPVLEKALARDAGLGWIGKHTNLINRRGGSWFFLGEIYTDLPLPVDRAPAAAHCGRCTRCIEVCPTQAIVGPYELDARRCIAYLTIELRGSVPAELRPLIGNRIFGCDDCQLVCPWNRFAGRAELADFETRQGLDAASLTELFSWGEEDFRARTEGMALRRTGYLGWLRNLAIGLGNAPPSATVRACLDKRASHPSDLVREHVRWALDRQAAGLLAANPAEVN